MRQVTKISCRKLKNVSKTTADSLLAVCREKKKNSLNNSIQMICPVAEGANRVSGLAYWFGCSYSGEEHNAEKLGFFLEGSASNS